MDNDDIDVIMYTAAGTAAVAGALNPFPFVGDGLILITAWGGMLTAISAELGFEFDMKSFKIIALQAFQSVALYAMGTLSFIYLLKYTGLGTPAAAMANAALNFGFTLGVGTMYRNAWEKGEEPTSQDILDLLKGVIGFFKDGLTKEKRASMLNSYNDEIDKGNSKSSSFTTVLKKFFNDFFK